MVISLYESSMMVLLQTTNITQISPNTVGFKFNITMTALDDFVYDGATHLINTSNDMSVTGLYDVLGGVDIIKGNIVNNDLNTGVLFINPVRVSNAGVVSDGVQGFVIA